MICLNSELISRLLSLLETALCAPTKTDRASVFVEALSDLSELQIKHAFKRAVKSWQPAYGRTFPSPAELREYAEELDGTVSASAQSISEIDPEKLPKGWTEQEWKRAKVTPQVTRANAGRPLDPDPNAELNESRKDFAARLIAEMRAAVRAGANSFPGGTQSYEEHVAQLARERLWPSEMPSDPDKRKPWARQKALDQGWL